MNIPTISIIGLGALGRTLARACVYNNLAVESVFNRTQYRAQETAAALDIETAGSFPQEARQLGTLVFVTVSDAAIASVSKQLAALAPNFSGTTVVHCSGNESAEVLSILKEKGAHIASMHPLQTFTENSGAQTFANIYCSLQGDRACLPMLNQLAERLGARTIEITADQKSRLHAAAVFASNYLVTLLEASVAAAGPGIEGAQLKQALLPLVETTLQNVKDQSFSKALSGPIKRGDIQTVQNHLGLLEGNEELLELYRLMGRRTIRLAEEDGSLDNASAAMLNQLLNGDEFKK